jgi:hypothetical protein
VMVQPSLIVSEGLEPAYAIVVRPPLTPQQWDRYSTLVQTDVVGLGNIVDKQAAVALVKAVAPTAHISTGDANANRR